MTHEEMENNFNKAIEVIKEFDLQHVYSVRLESFGGIMVQTKECDSHKIHEDLERHEIYGCKFYKGVCLICL